MGTIVCRGWLASRMAKLASQVAAALFGAAALLACGGGSPEPEVDPPPPVIAPPVITAQPQASAVDDGAAATFTVTATGSGLAYQWLRNDANIAGASTASYTVAAAALADTGARFAVAVSNTAGTVTSSEAVLTVRAVAPTITAQPLTATVTAGATTTFSVAAAGSAPLSYQWQRSGVDILGATGPNYTTAAVTMADDGTAYSVRVSNAAGQVTSTIASLAVIGTGSSSAEPRLAIGGTGVTSSNLVRAADGRVWAWGGNFTGKIGDGATFASRPTPFQWPGVTGVGSLTVGNAHSFAVRSDGAALGTGQNMAAQIGTGSASNFAAVPTSATVLIGIRSMAAGANQYTVAVKTDGTVWHWGTLPNGTQSSVALQVPGLSGIKSVCAGLNFNGYALAVKGDGTVWFWGNDTINGSLSGQGTAVRSVGTPLQVGGLTEVSQVRCGAFVAMALRRDGSVWSWGSGSELGNGDTARDQFTPTPIAGLENIASIGLWYTSGVAVDSAGVAWTWGDNSSGQLALGDDVRRNRPVRVTSIADVVEAAAGYQHLLFLKRDGTVWAAGSNQVGELGNQAAAAKESRPVQVPGLNLN